MIAVFEPRAYRNRLSRLRRDGWAMKELGTAALITIGWREWVKLPAFGVRIKAKVDTGARTSVLHAFSLETLTREGHEWLRFEIHPDQHASKRTVIAEAPVADRRRVTDSGGHREWRYIIETPVELGGRTWPIQLSLSSRTDMRFRMLLGRTAIRRRALVDPARSFLTHNA